MPFSETVGTWPLNDTYLSVIQHLEGQWRARGFQWCFGTEINFTIKEASALEKAAARESRLLGLKSRRSYERLNRYEQGDMTPYFAAQAELPDADAPFLQAIAEVEEMLEIQGRRIGLQPPHVREQFQANQRETQRIFKSYLHSERTRRDHEKRANVFLAWLHVMPSACGGIADMVDMRFGNERHGRGWWDCGHDIELRFFNRGAFDIIQSYNRAGFLFFEACKRFGFIPRIKNNLSQLHFSVLEGEARNIMSTEDAAAIEMRQKMTDGLFSACTFLPFMYMGSARDSGNMVIDFSSGPTRLNNIRFCDESWELRRFYPDTLGHIAQDVAFALIGCSARVFTDLTTETPCAGFIINEKTAIDLVTTEIANFQHLRVRDHSDRKCAAIKSCLEAAHVKSDGYLDVPMPVLYENHELLVAEIGTGAVDQYTIVEDGYVLNLGDIEYARVWQSLFSKIRYDRNTGDLDVSKLPKVVQAWFLPFEVSALRTDFIEETRMIIAPEYIHRASSHYEAGDFRINHVPVEDTMRIGNFFRTYIARQGVKDRTYVRVGASAVENGISLNPKEADAWHAKALSDAVVPQAALAGRTKDDGVKGLGITESLHTSNDIYLTENAAYKEADTYPETKASALFRFEYDLYSDRARFFDLRKLTKSLARTAAYHQRLGDITLDKPDTADVVEYIIQFCAFLKKDYAGACMEAAWLKDNWLNAVKTEIAQMRADEAEEEKKDSNSLKFWGLPTPEISDETYQFIDAAVRRACEALPTMKDECAAWAKKLPDCLEVPIVERELQGFGSDIAANMPVVPHI